MISVYLLLDLLAVEKLLPELVLLKVGVERDLARRNREEILARLILAHLAESSIYVTTYVEDINRSTCNLGAEEDIGVSGVVEEVELVPTDEVPIAILLVHHKFAATAAAYLIDEARNAHVVVGVIDGIE